MSDRHSFDELRINMMSLYAASLVRKCSIPIWRTNFPPISNRLFNKR